MARERPGGDLRGGVVGEPRELIELGTVVGDEQREGLVVAGVVRTPQGDLQFGAERARGHRQRVGGARHPLGGQPRRFHVARQLHHRLVTERAGCAQRVGGIAPMLVAAVGALDCQGVLEAVERRRRHEQRPGITRVDERVCGHREAAVGHQPHAGELRIGVGEAEDDRVALHERAGGDDRRHGRQASGRGLPMRRAASIQPARRQNDAMASDHTLSALLVGGPTAVLEYAGLRLLTDPTFDAARRAGERPDQAHRTRGERRRRRPDRRRPALPRPALRQPRRQRARVPGARRAHADHALGRRAPRRQCRRPRALDLDRARAPGRRRRHRHRRPGPARARGLRARDRPRGRLRPEPPTTPRRCT